MSALGFQAHGKASEDGNEMWVSESMAKGSGATRPLAVYYLSKPQFQCCVLV